PAKIPAPPDDKARPRSAAEMEQILTELVPPERRGRIAVRVIDLSGFMTPAAKPKRSPARRKSKNVSQGHKRAPAAKKARKNAASKTKKRSPSKALKKKKGAKAKPTAQPRGRKRQRS